MNIDDIYQDYSFCGVLSNMKTSNKARRSALCALLSLCVLSFAGALDYFAEGERLFKSNKPDEAIPMLFQASQLAGTDP